MNKTEQVEISIVVPTFQEAENIAALAERINIAMVENNRSYEMIVVDDDSGDGIDAEVEKLNKKNLPVNLIIRKAPRDLSRAVLCGFENAKGRVLVCMDADLSHPPKAIEQMLQKLQNGCDFVLASRYTAGASVGRNWSTLRKLNSKIAALPAKMFTPVSDPMSGFFALPADVFRRAEKLDSVGFKIGLELIVKCKIKRVEEIPIHFSERRSGKSKLSFAEQIKYLWHIYRLAKFKFFNK
ncbi:MAG: polyprenol monophosphomannose synthase [Phycisphaerae bacterium]|jgi:dolichol-phosphate mannosyltransferase